MLELIDEADPFRASWLEPLRDGRAGERPGDVSAAVRPGRGGGNLRWGFGDGGAAGRGLSLSTGGGGRMGLLTPTGMLAPAFVIEEPNVGIGGLFVVWTRVGAAGLPLDVGMGGGGLLPNV